MNNEIFITDENDLGYSFRMEQSDNGSKYVELSNVEDRIIFYYKCDSLITGNFILHLEKAIKTYKKNKNKVILTRWYPHVDPAHFISIIGTDSISTSIQFKDKKDIVRLLVYTESVRKPIVFEIPLESVEEFIK